jgi:hypothetical protein
MKYDHADSRTEFNHVVYASENLKTAKYTEPAFGRKPSGSIYAGIKTENEIFDYLSTSVPNVNDEILLTGACELNYSAVYRPFVVSRAKRISTGVIYVYGFNPDAGDRKISTLTDGSGAGAFDNISIAW